APAHTEICPLSLHDALPIFEPDAGSDVGAGRTKAYKQPDGSWHIEGVKRFITSGEQDMTDNIIHYVLARPVGEEGAGGPGTKGLDRKSTRLNSSHVKISYAV